MKKHHRLWILTLLILCSTVLILPVVQADVGGGVDWGVNDWGGNLGDFDDFGGGGYGGGGFSLFSLFPFFAGGRTILILIVIFAVLRLVRKSSGEKRRSSGGHSPDSSGMRYRPMEREKNLEALIQKDPNFSKPDFLLRASDVFVALQQAWTEKDWRSIRAFESNRLYDIHSRQLQIYIDRHQTNVVEDISVIDQYIENYEEDAENEYLSVILEARYRDYVIDDETQKVVKGDADNRYLMTYHMQFMRKLGVKTESNSATKVTQCPNCGAPMSINQNGICDFCGAEVTTGANQWVLTALQPLQQRSM